jgi:AsmA protein
MDGLLKAADLSGFARVPTVSQSLAETAAMALSLRSPPRTKVALNSRFDSGSPPVRSCRNSKSMSRWDGWLAAAVLRPVLGACAMINSGDRRGVMPTYKVLGGLVFALLAIVAVALLGVKLLVHPNDYKPRIVAAVRKATGRELLLRGDITLSVFPWIALELGSASLGNPPGFEAQRSVDRSQDPSANRSGSPSEGLSGNPSGNSFGNPTGNASGNSFMSFSHASVRVKFLPLLAKRLEIGRIEVDGLELKLLRNAEGKGNWSGFGGSEAHAVAVDSAAPAPAAPVAADGGMETGTTLLGIEEIKITNARVSYQGLMLSNLNLETGSYVANGVVPVNLHLDFERGPRSHGVPEDGVAGEQRGGPPKVDTVAAAGEQGSGLPEGHEAGAVSERASRLPDGGASGKGGVQGSVDARFNFTADPAAQRYAVAALNLNSVVTLADNRRAVRFNISAPGIDVNLASQTLTAPDFGLNLAGAQVSGRLEATGILGLPALTGSVKLEPLVVREYLPRLGVAVPRARDPKAYSLVSGAADFAYAKDSLRLEKLQATLDDTQLHGALALALDTRAVNFDLAVDALDADRYLPPAEAPEPRLGPAPAPPTPGEEPPPFEPNGTLALNAVHLAPLDLANVRVTVSTNDRVTRIFPLNAVVDGGQYSGDISLDHRGAVPVLSLDEHLSGIDVGKLLAGGPAHLHLSGRGNVNLKASGRGTGTDTMVKSLSGKFDANIVDGAVEGLDLSYELARADSLLGRVDLPAAQNTRRTTFDAFKVSATIANGVAETRDLTISSAALKVTGDGSVNLPAKSVNFSLLADMHRTIGDTPLQIPLKVTGPMSDPNVMPDVEALAKGELQRKLKDIVHDKLKSLFGRP